MARLTLFMQRKKHVESLKIFIKIDIHCWFMFGLFGLFVGWFHFCLVVVSWLLLVSWLVVGLSFWKVLWLRPSEPAVGRHFYIGSVQPWKALGRWNGKPPRCFSFTVFFGEAISRVWVAGVGDALMLIILFDEPWWVFFHMVHGGFILFFLLYRFFLVLWLDVGAAWSSMAGTPRIAWVVRVVNC